MSPSQALRETLLRCQGRSDNGLLLDWRNRDAELVAAAVAALLVRRTGARATIAHVSNPEVAAYVASERARGGTLAAEGCPQYFLLREDEVHDHGALRKFTPPARARTEDDETQMWRLLREGVLTHMSTDHAPSTLEQKRAGDMWDVHFGLPGLDSTTMALLLDAAARGHLAYEDVARVYSQNPAKAYGLWPQKGRLGVGADADIVLVDAGRRRGYVTQLRRAVEGRVDAVRRPRGHGSGGPNLPSRRTHRRERKTDGRPLRPVPPGGRRSTRRRAQQPPSRCGQANLLQPFGYTTKTDRPRTVGRHSERHDDRAGHR